MPPENFLLDLTPPYSLWKKTTLPLNHEKEDKTVLCNSVIENSFSITLRIKKSFPIHDYKETDRNRTCGLKPIFLCSKQKTVDFLNCPYQIILNNRAIFSNKTLSLSLTVSKFSMVTITVWTHRTSRIRRNCRWMKIFLMEFFSHLRFLCGVPFD